MRPPFSRPALILALLAFAGVAHGEPFFKAPFVSYDTGASAWGVAVADLDRDGHPDLAVANRGDNTVSVLLGDGSGSFHPKTDYPASYAPRGVLATDLNGDGIPDLIASSNGSAITILIGRGDGTFQLRAPVSVSDGGELRTVAVTDLNHDGHPDLVMVSPGYLPAVFAALGRGDGGFFATYRLRAGGRPVSLDAGDLNADGNPDLVVGDGEFPGAVTVLLGNGDGTVRTGPTVLTAANPKSLSLSDLDGDGKLDLLVLSTDMQLEGTALVLAGHGDGTFGSPTSYPAGRYVSGTMTLADLDGDSVTDLLIPTWGLSRVNIIPGHGDGTFGAMKSLLTESYPQTAAVGDLDGDGHADIATSNLIPGTVSVHLAHGDGTYGTDKQIPVGSLPVAVVTGDLNGDGRADLVSANHGSGSVSVLVNEGATTFVRHDYAAGAGTSAVGITDLDGDARPDVAAANHVSNTLSIFHGVGDGTLVHSHDVPTPPAPNSLSIHDLNGDGTSDITTSSGDAVFACILQIEFSPRLTTGAPAAGSVATFLGSAGGALSPRSTMPVGSLPEHVAVGDLDGDRVPDMVTADPRLSKVFLALGRGDGTFAPPSELANLIHADAVAISDLNRDGVPDLIVGRSDPCGTGGGGINLFLGQSGGAFQAADSFPTSGTVDLAIGDLNGDGLEDIASANVANTVSVFFGNGDGTLRPKITFGAGDLPRSVAIADLDGDGRQDLALADANGNALTILLNTGGIAARPARAIVTGGERTIPVGRHSPDLCVRIEPLAGAFDVSDVDAATIRMVSDGTGSLTWIPPTAAKRRILGDSDGNGIVELPICFGGDDLDALFAGIRGRRTLAVSIEGRLLEGTPFHATLVLTVVRTGGPIRAAVTPNPVRGAGAVIVTTQRAGPLRVTLYDAAGRLVRVIADRRMAPAGDHSFAFDGGGGSGVPSGIYFYRVEAADGSRTGKVVIAK